MGSSGSTQKKNQNIQKNKDLEANGSNHKIEQNKNNKERIKEDYLPTHAEPITKDEILKLYSYESALCKIKNNDKTGTGFFCEISDKNIPFKKVLFTNNHVINNINNNIIIEYLNKEYKLTLNRRIYTNENLDYTCIEILDTDIYKNYFEIDNTIFLKKEILNGIEAFILQYPKNGPLKFQVGRIIDINNNEIKHSVPTDHGSSGSPLIKRNQLNLIIGIHKEHDFEHYNYAIPFDIIINDIKNQILNNNNINNIEYRNIINLIYEKKEYYYDEDDKKDCNNIFGSKFVKNNKNNIELIINDKKSELIDKYNLKVGINNIQIIIKNKIINFEEMFYGCISLKNIDELKYLDVSNGNNFSYMFNWCKSLSDIKSLENWNVSNGNNFRGMFSGCKSLSDIKPLKNWNVSKEDFDGMF